MPPSAESPDPPEPTSVLLRRFVRAGSQQAFAGLVRRYGGLVYETALRRTGHAATAEDVTQLVFADLARRAPAMAEDDRLGAWLHRRTLMAAADVMKSERRRARRESAATTEPAPGETESSGWLELAPVLDESLARLRAVDRLVLVQRFLEGRSIREIGEALNIGEDAAQKRISRAAEKLRRSLTSRGVTLSGGVIIGLMKDHLKAAVTNGLAAKIAPAALRRVTGFSRMFWRFLPVAIPAGTGMLAVALVSAAPWLRTPQATGAHSTPPAPASEPIATRRGYAPGMTLRETAEAIADSFVRHPRHVPQIVSIERMALAASVPQVRSEEALDLLLGAVRKRGTEIDSNQAACIGDLWVMNLLRDDPGAMLDRLRDAPERWFQSVAGLRVYDGIRDQPPEVKTELARRILDDPVLSALSEIQGVPARIYADGDGDGRPDPDRREALFAEALQKVQKGGGYKWAKAATVTLHDEADCRTLLEASADLPAEQLGKLQETVMSFWSGVSVATLAEWAETQPEGARQQAAMSIFYRIPARMMDDPAAGWMARADWVAAAFPGFAGSLGTLVDRAAAEPDGWGEWLERHPEVIRGHASEMESMLNAKLTEHMPATPQRVQDESLNKPVLDRLRPGFLAWKRVDPEALAATLEKPIFGNRGALQSALRQLAAETP